MSQISKEWFEYARIDLKNAGILFENKSYKDSIWFCHQAIEKLLKAIIISHGKNVRKIHDLVELWEEAILVPNKSISRFLEELNPYYIPTRYPEAGFKLKIIYTKRTAHKILKTVQEVFKWLRIQLNHNG